MEAKRKAMDGALVPAKRPRNELVAVSDKENALVQSVCISGWGIIVNKTLLFSMYFFKNLCSCIDKCQTYLKP